MIVFLPSRHSTGIVTSSTKQQLYWQNRCSNSQSATFRPH